MKFGAPVLLVYFKVAGAFHARAVAKVVQTADFNLPNVDSDFQRESSRERRTLPLSIYVTRLVVQRVVDMNSRELFFNQLVASCAAPINENPFVGSR